jgi:hypothetical protein|tara:strand:+ start:481 stop:678 length:198 start_codon:yes stop_codon:yes gene_type:complete
MENTTEDIRTAVEQEVHHAIRHGDWIVLLPDGNEVEVQFRRDGTTEIYGDDGQVEHRLQVCVLAR